MITVPPGVRVLVWSTPVDFRAGMDRLAALVQVTLRLDPFAGDVFVFRSRRLDRIKPWTGSSCSSTTARV
jgi:transposase